MVFFIAKGKRKKIAYFHPDQDIRYLHRQKRNKNTLTDYNWLIGKSDRISKSPCCNRRQQTPAQNIKKDYFIIYDTAKIC